MTFLDAAALFAAMALLAAIPSVSVMAVAASSASSGFSHGLATTAGVVLGDVIFILLAIFGLVFLVEVLGEWFVVVKYAAGIYLIWLALKMWRAGSGLHAREGSGTASLQSSFLTGLLITLADQKAVFFYLAFLPAFLDLSALSLPEVALVLAITLLAVGGAKLCYACASARAGAFLNERASRGMNILAAAVMVLAGIMVMAGI